MLISFFNEKLKLAITRLSIIRTYSQLVIMAYKKYITSINYKYIDSTKDPNAQSDRHVFVKKSKTSASFPDSLFRAYIYSRTLKIKNEDILIYHAVSFQNEYLKKIWPECPIKFLQYACSFEKDKIIIGKYLHTCTTINEHVVPEMMIYEDDQGLKKMFVKRSLNITQAEIVAEIVKYNPSMTSLKIGHFDRYNRYKSGFSYQECNYWTSKLNLQKLNIDTLILRCPLSAYADICDILNNNLNLQVLKIGIHYPCVKEITDLESLLGFVIKDFVTKNFSLVEFKVYVKSFRIGKDLLNMGEPIYMRKELKQNQDFLVRRRAPLTVQAAHIYARSHQTIPSLEIIPKEPHQAILEQRKYLKTR